MKKGTYKHSLARLKKMSKAQKGHIVLESTKEILHKTHKGKHYSPNTEFKKGKDSIYWKGGRPKCIDCKNSVKNYVSKRCAICFNKFNIGENNKSWKGGITPINKKIRTTIEYDLWRNSVFARDGYTCQKTDIKGGKLVAHHIQNFSDSSELRFAIDNGITLSEKVHKEFHKIYGRKNNTRGQLLEFLIKKNEK